MKFSNTNLRIEVEKAIECGMSMVSRTELDSMIKKLGYVRDKESRCACIARNLTTGNTYPNVNFGVIEKDTGRSAFHFESRRDANFQALQKIRMDIFCVVRNAWWGI